MGNIKEENLLGYTILREIGEGGMGKVYLAENASIGQRVAIKVLDPVLARNPELRERFKQEARIQVALQHNNIVRIFNAQSSDELSFLVMEYIEGESLEKVLRRREKLPVDEALKVFKQVLDAVGYAHSKGIVHRDLKPSNILVCADGTTKVTDFGIAKVLGDTKLTRTGTSMGSPNYMSPEQVLGKKDIDHRTDIYSLGATLYEVLTGKPPFVLEDGSHSDSDFLIKSAHVSRSARMVHEVVDDVPEQYSFAVMRALSKIPENRYSDCADFSRALEAGKIPQGSQGALHSPARMTSTTQVSTDVAFEKKSRGFRFEITRVTRREFFLYWFFAVFCMMTLQVWLDEQFQTIPSIVLQIVIQIFLWKYAAARMHDSGKRAWWIFVPVMNFIFVFFKGDPKANRYGANPRDLSTPYRVLRWNGPIRFAVFASIATLFVGLYSRNNRVLLSALGLSPEYEVAQRLCHGAAHQKICVEILADAARYCENESPKSTTPCLSTFIASHEKKPKDTTLIYATLDENIAVRWALVSFDSGKQFRCEGFNYALWETFKDFEVSVSKQQTVMVLDDGGYPTFAHRNHCELYREQLDMQPESYGVESVGGKNVCVARGPFVMQKQVQYAILKDPVIEYDKPNFIILAKDGMSFVLTDNKDVCEEFIRRLED